MDLLYCYLILWMEKGGLLRKKDLNMSKGFGLKLAKFGFGQLKFQLVVYFKARYHYVMSILYLANDSCPFMCILK